MDGLQASLVAGAIGSLAGLMAGGLALLGTDLSGSAEPQPIAPLDRRLAVGAFLLSSHAIAAAALWQLPTVGSCIAAGLGAGWMGAAAAGLVGMLTQPERIGVRMAHIALRAVIAVGLLAPLWAYIRVMQFQALDSVHA
jgi:hypothetical protein